MGVPETRTPEAVRREIEAERAQLAAAVSSLRGRLGEAADVGTHVRSRMRLFMPAGFAAGFLLAGGVGASMRLVARRSRER
jgi:hypothetical protein